jgi:hypothetical protein
MPYFEPSRPRPDSFTSPKGATFGRDDALIDADDTVLEALRDPPDAADIAGVEVRGKTERGVVARAREKGKMGSEPIFPVGSFVEGALNAGLLACLVRTGKYQAGDENKIAGNFSVVDSVSDAVHLALGARYRKTSALPPAPAAAALHTTPVPGSTRGAWPIHPPVAGKR